MTLIKGAFVHMVLSRQLVLAVSGIGMVALARLLTPADFGIFATVLATFLLLEIVVRFGLVEYLISAPRLSTGMLRSALGLSSTIAAGMIALAATFLLTPFSAWLSSNLRLSLLVMVPALAVIPLILVPEAVLRRRLQFGVIAWLNVGTATSDVAVSIALALLDAGPLALVGGLVASRVTSAAILLATSRRLLRARWTGWRRFLAFAPHMTATSLLPKASDFAVTLIIPSALGIAALGLYNRAQSVVSLLDKALLDGVGQVVLPALSDRLRAGAAIADVYGAQTARLSVLIWPVFAVLALLAEQAVLVLLGDQWTAAIPIVRILCAAGLVAPFTSMSAHFFAATGQIESYLRIQAVNQFATMVCIGLGALHSLEAVACGVALSRALKALHIRRSLDASLGSVGRRGRRIDNLRAAGVSLFSLAGPALLLATVPGAGPVVLFGGGILLAALGWLAGILVTRHPLLEDLRTLPILTQPAFGRFLR